MNGDKKLLDKGLPEHLGWPDFLEGQLLLGED